MGQIIFAVAVNEFERDGISLGKLTYIFGKALSHRTDPPFKKHTRLMPGPDLQIADVTNIKANFPTLR
jgi:hypothetical protein